VWDAGAGSGAVGGGGASCMLRWASRMAMLWVRLSTGNSGRVGIRTTQSQRSRSSRHRPLVSFPKTRAAAFVPRATMTSAASSGVDRGWLSRPRPEAVAMEVRTPSRASGSESWRSTSR
jgi:hypothetical protein